MKVKVKLKDKVSVGVSEVEDKKVKRAMVKLGRDRFYRRQVSAPDGE